jgi:hypothetical protein
MTPQAEALLLECWQETRAARAFSVVTLGARLELSPRDIAIVLVELKQLGLIEPKNPEDDYGLLRSFSKLTERGIEEALRRGALNGETRRERR